MSFLNYDYPHTTFYDSDLRELIEMYKKLVAEYADILKRLTTLEDEYSTIDEKIATQIESLKKEISESLIRILDEYETRINANIGDLRKEITEMRETLNELESMIDMLKTYVDSVNAETIATLEKKIADITAGIWLEFANINERLNNIIYEYPEVQNPINLDYEDLQSVLNDLYESLRVHAFTAIGFDESAVTCGVFDQSRISAKDYDVNGRFFFAKKELPNMFDPTSGKYRNYKDVIYSVDRRTAIYAFTAEWFDARGLDCAELDRSDLSAYDYDYNAEDHLRHYSDLLELNNGLYLLYGIEQTNNATITFDLSSAEYVPYMMNAYSLNGSTWSACNVFLADRLTITANSTDELTEMSYHILLKER